MTTATTTTADFTKIGDIIRNLASQEPRENKQKAQRQIVDISITSVQQIYRKLDGHDIRLIEELVYLSRLQSKKSPSGAKYCCPSEIYLAKKLGVRREAVSRHVSKLARLGVLEVTHRRKVRGMWQTNLYRVRRAFAWLIGKVMAIINYRKDRVRPKAHITLLKEEKENQQKPERTDFKPKYSLTELFLMVRRGEKLPEM